MTAPSEAQKRRAEELAKKFKSENEDKIDSFPHTMVRASFEFGYLAAIADAEKLVGALELAVYNKENEAGCDCCGNNAAIFDELSEALREWRGEKSPREHTESADCWCKPELVADHTEQGGTKQYLHKEEQ